MYIAKQLLQLCYFVVTTYKNSSTIPYIAMNKLELPTTDTMWSLSLTFPLGY